MRKARLNYAARAPWNKRAGTNRNAREARGRHTENPGYAPGDNWVVCQRCGMDVYASTVREDGYREGLIVCPKCYDAPHPQDYVRAFDDTLTPHGHATGDDNFSRTGAVGSTTSPAQSGIGSDFTGSMSDISDQTNEELETISTLSVAGNFPTSYYDVLLGAEQSVASYSASGLPAGLTIDSSGDITGTVGGSENDDSPHTVTITAVYDSGLALPNASFTWTISEVFNPSLIAGISDWGWWDMSFAGVVAGDGGTWQDDGITPCVNGSVMQRVDDRSGNGNHGTFLFSGQKWASNQMNGWGVGDFNGAGGNIKCPTVAVNALEWSCCLIVELDSSSQWHAAIGGTGAGNPAPWHIGPNGSGTHGCYERQPGGAGDLMCATNEPDTQNVSKGYHWFFFNFTQSASESWVNNTDRVAGLAWHDDHGPGPTNIGADPTGSNDWQNNIIEWIIYDKTLDASERTDLWEYHDARYAFVL